MEGKVILSYKAAQPEAYKDVLPDSQFSTACLKSKCLGRTQTSEWGLDLVWLCSLTVGDTRMIVPPTPIPTHPLYLGLGISRCPVPLLLLGFLLSTRTIRQNKNKMSFVR